MSLSAQTIAQAPDELLETRIEAARRAALNSRSDTLQRWHFEHMRDLIAQRSPERISQMERERGL